MECLVGWLCFSESALQVPRQGLYKGLDIYYRRGGPGRNFKAEFFIVPPVLDTLPKHLAHPLTESKQNCILVKTKVLIVFDLIIFGWMGVTRPVKC